MQQFGIGQSVPRFEDGRLLRGAGRYVHDIDLPGQAYAVIVRSPHAHARVRSIDTSGAAALPGVVAVLTGADLAAENLGSPSSSVKRNRPDGSPMFAPVHPILARTKVRYVGDPIALVVARTLNQARDAAERVEIDYEPLPAVVSGVEAVKPGSAAVWDECPDNISNVWQVGDRTAAEEAFRRAVHVVRRRYVITRVHAQYLETRGAIGHFDIGEDRFTLYVDCQYPHRVRQLLSQVFRVAEQKVRVITNDVGGGFGTKGWQYPEHRLVLWAARKLGCPVKWVCDRSEAVMADEHGRDNVTDAELALDAEGKFVGLRVQTLAAIGAYISSDRNLLPTFANVGGLVGVYTIPAAHVQVTSVLINTNSTAPYRGAGRPEATYVIERLIDDAAFELGLDPADLRRRNLIPSPALPYKTALTFTYDSGEFERGMTLALEHADYAGFATRRAESERRGKLRGIGIANAIERAAGPGLEYAEIRFTPAGTATLLMGTKGQGQGHETTFKQIAAEKLGLEPKDIDFVDGDTDKVAFGIGTYGSRSTVIGGTALVRAAEKLIAKGTTIAAHLLEAAEADIRFDHGRFVIAGSDRAIGLKDVAKAAFTPDKLPKGLEPGFYESGTFSPATDTFPNGSHVCEVEIDAETGQVEIASYVVVDDVGTVINPLTLKGQLHGGIVQGIGQILMERVAYDHESGQLLSASFMDYAMPRAVDVCMMSVVSNPVPTMHNPLGAKGAGEAGTVGALAAVMNGISNALSSVGAKSIDMPATSEKVWRAIRSAKAGQGP